MKKLPRSIDYKTATHDEIDEYGMSMLFTDAPELSVILKGHLLVEQVIETLISQKMSQPDRFFSNQRISFELKADLASALGVLPDVYLGAAKALNNIRNSYAHREDHHLKIEELNSLKIDWEPLQKEAYAVACAKGDDEATRIAIIFLHWSFLMLLPQAKTLGDS